MAMSLGGTQEIVGRIGGRVFSVEGLSFWQWYCCSYNYSKKLVDQVDLRPANMFRVNSLQGIEAVLQLILSSPFWDKIWCQVASHAAPGTL